MFHGKHRGRHPPPTCPNLSAPPSRMFHGKRPGHAATLPAKAVERAPALNNPDESPAAEPRPGAASAAAVLSGPAAQPPPPTPSRVSARYAALSSAVRFSASRWISGAAPATRSGWYSRTLAWYARRTSSRLAPSGTPSTSSGERATAGAAPRPREPGPPAARPLPSGLRRPPPPSRGPRRTRRYPQTRSATNPKRRSLAATMPPRTRHPRNARLAARRLGTWHICAHLGKLRLVAQGPMTPTRSRPISSATSLVIAKAPCPVPRSTATRPRPAPRRRASPSRALRPQARRRGGSGARG